MLCLLPAAMDLSLPLNYISTSKSNISEVIDKNSAIAYKAIGIRKGVTAALSDFVCETERLYQILSCYTLL